MSAAAETIDPAPAASALDRQIADMRGLLALMADASATDALKALRQAFPDAPLAARTTALLRHRF